MLGPLPRLYRTVIVSVVLLLGVAGGAWVAYMTALPVAAWLGAALGAVAAVLVALLVVHEPHRDLEPRVARRHRWS